MRKVALSVANFKTGELYAARPMNNAPTAVFKPFCAASRFFFTSSNAARSDPRSRKSRRDRPESIAYVPWVSGRTGFGHAALELVCRAAQGQGRQEAAGYCLGRNAASVPVVCSACLALSSPRRFREPSITGSSRGEDSAGSGSLTAARDMRDMQLSPVVPVKTASLCRRSDIYTFSCPKGVKLAYIKHITQR